MYRLPATFLCILLILYLFWIDRKKNSGISKAIWIPFIWMLFAGSREISFWLHYFFNIGAYSATITEGNPIERAFHTMLIVIGLMILIRRRLNWGEIFKKNKFILIYFIFALISFLWSDYPFVSLKRWIKTMGTFIMVLVILTEDRPYAAIGVILKRLAFVFLPLSVLLIQYYPIGKSYHDFSGAQRFTGVAGGKNGLGMLCLLSGVYFSYALLFIRRGSHQLGQTLNPTAYIVLLPMLLWLFYKANSATALLCIVVAAALLIVARQPAMLRNPNGFIAVCLGFILIFGVMELAFDVKNTVITALGRRPDLTTRVPMWHDLLAMVQNPLIGFGNESFWLGDRLISVQERYGELIQAHNGYIETYLNLGAIGLFLLAGCIVSSLKNVAGYLKTDYSIAILRFCFIVVVCVYNLAEATFYGVSNMWALFLLGATNLARSEEEDNLIKVDAADNS